MKEKLVVIGNGMSGLRTIEDLLEITKDKYEITEQNTKNFWGAEKIKDVSIRSDILIKDIEKNTFFVLDTKWKIPTNLKISIEDLRQMYVYYDYYN